MFVCLYIEAYVIIFLKEFTASFITSNTNLLLFFFFFFFSTKEQVMETYHKTNCKTVKLPEDSIREHLCASGFRRIS